MHPDRSSDDEKVIPLRREDRSEKAGRAEEPGRREGARPFPSGRVGQLAAALLGDVGIEVPASGEEAWPSLPPSDEDPLGSFTLEELSLAVDVARNALLQSAESGESPPVPRLHGELDAAVMRRCEALLRRQTRSHNRFLQDVSHDIRSPLNSILFLADALRAEHGGPLNRVQSRQANVLFMASVSLVKLVNDLIDHARLDEDVPIRVATTAFSIQEVVAELRHLVGPLLTYQSVRLMVDLRGEGNRRGDAQLLARVLLNLVTNAAQALPEGGSIRIGVDGTAREDLRITVRDDGTEADIDALRRGLEDATRGHPPGETRGWTHGLGLTISARLVEAAGGSISVRTSPEGGTLFDLAFPFPPV